MGKVYFIRHGQASVFSDNYDQLSDLGHQQARKLGTFLKKERVEIDQLYCGPLRRHRETVTGILDGMGISQEVKEIDGLKEHQGYSILKKYMAELMEEDAKIRELVNRPWTDFKDQIKHHIRIYEYFSLKWAQGTYDHLISDEFQPWDAFANAASDAYDQVTSETPSGATTLVITSGGPKAIACGKAMQLDTENILRTSWVIYNCSVSEFLINSERTSLSTFNQITYLEDKEHRTLV